jgi:plastocyanin
MRIPASPWSGARRHALRTGVVTGLLAIVLTLATVTLAAPAHKSRRGVKRRHATRVCHLTRRRHGKKRIRVCHRLTKRSTAQLKQKSGGRSTGTKTGAPGSPSSPTASTSPTSTSPGGASTAPGLTPPASGETPTTPTPTPTPPVGPSRVQVTAEDTEGFHFVLSRHEVPAGKVIIEFIDHGQDEHNLNSRTGSSITPISPDLRSGELKDEEFNFAPGSYTLFCSLPEHEAKGMKATLTVY